MHPDDQVEELKRGLDPTKGEPEREWVLPTYLAEKWSLRRFGKVFDAVGEEPPEEEREEEGKEEVSRDESEDGGAGGGPGGKKRRGGKRILLATLGDDSTVVYYIIHDGIVKPRQN